MSRTISSTVKLNMFCSKKYSPDNVTELTVVLSGQIYHNRRRRRWRELGRAVYINLYWWYEVLPQQGTTITPASKYWRMGWLSNELTAYIDIHTYIHIEKWRCLINKRPSHKILYWHTFVCRLDVMQHSKAILLSITYFIRVGSSPRRVPNWRIIVERIEGIEELLDLILSLKQWGYSYHVQSYELHNIVLNRW